MHDFARRFRPASAAVVLIALALLAANGLTGCGDSKPAPVGHDQSATVLVAVASNFVTTLTVLQKEFEATTPHRLAMSAGSTGKLYAQIVAGAPYDVLLAADQLRPRLLQGEGLAKSRFSYAQGQLVLWSTQPDVIAGDLLGRLRELPLPRIALASPELAPYGNAAKQALDALGIFANVQSRLVFGENVGQAHAMVATGNAEFGFTALSYVLATELNLPVTYQLIDDSLYSGLIQDGVWLQRASDNPAAKAFSTFIQSPEAQAIIELAGYIAP